MKVSGVSAHSLRGGSVDALMRIEVTAPDQVREALHALYAEHARGLFLALRRLTPGGCDASDLLHEVFVVALKRSRSLLEADSPKAWLYGVATHVAASAGRKRRSAT